MNIPYVIEKGPNNQERSYDLFSRLLKDRIIFIKGPISSGYADAVVAQLLFLESDSPDKDIYMYINSPGGYITEMYGIYDAMTYVRPDIITMGYGQCCSAGSFLLAAGTKGKRFALPNADIMIHEMAGGTSGKFNDMKNDYNKMERLYAKMAEHYVEFTGQPVEKVKKDMERDHWLTAEEAKDYGLVDTIQYSRE